MYIRGRRLTKGDFNFQKAHETKVKLTKERCVRTKESSTAIKWIEAQGARLLREQHESEDPLCWEPIIHSQVS
ncbi:hypothetical protein GCM10007096_33170 [Pullulanibacillus pueri]|uniref:Uncharacterized protein n=1 Tax=Pullulanibacillus pueri TaxID=1437324 RepID=A0A8J2ZZH1_9BACL|nr:hypothetical protein GCM10007096_33170 [Pullulanibacillus pueri]